MTAENKHVKPTTVFFNDLDDLKGKPTDIGASRSDHRKNILASQAVQALWVKNSSSGERDKQLSATDAALVGIRPKDEVEGMMAAQLIAAHNAAMLPTRSSRTTPQRLISKRPSHRLSVLVLAGGNDARALSAAPNDAIHPARGRCSRGAGSFGLREARAGGG